MEGSRGQDLSCRTKKDTEEGVGRGVGAGERKRRFSSAEVQCCKSVSELLSLTDPAAEETVCTQYVSSALMRAFKNTQDLSVILISHVS